MTTDIAMYLKDFVKEYELWYVRANRSFRFVLMPRNRRYEKGEEENLIDSKKKLNFIRTSPSLIALGCVVVSCENNSSTC